MSLDEALGLGPELSYFYGGAIMLSYPLQLPDDLKEKYDFLGDDVTPFGLDLFGNIFAEKQGECYLLNIETGESDVVSESAESFFSSIEKDREYLTAETLLEEWEKINGKLSPGFRLMPLTPFFLGGDYSIDNLKSAPVDQVLSLFSDIHVQTKDLPDGASIELSFT